LDADVLSKAADTIEGWWNRIPGFWQAQTVGWGVFSLVDLVDCQLTYHDLAISLFLTLLIAPCSVLLSTGMGAIYVSRSVDNRLTSRTLALITLFSFGAASVIVVMLFIIHQVSGWMVLDGGPVERFVVPLVHYFLAFAGWSLGYFWISAESAERKAHRRALLAEAEALRAELEELRLQLDPHFLFNALNGVVEEIPEHPSAALAMLRDLTAYLRHSLAGIKQTVVTVEAEVEALAAYLRVQEARFGTRLRTKLHVGRGAASHRIASFLLQPLVENAVKHGSREDGLDVSVDIRSSGEVLRIEIENSGSLDGGIGPRRHRPAIGLENVRRRLALHYLGRHQFTLRQRSTDAEVEPQVSRVIATLVLEGEPCSGS